MNEALRRSASIIPFPTTRVREREPVDQGETRPGKILFFMGVRYERPAGDFEHYPDDHRPPRQGGGRS